MFRAKKQEKPQPRVDLFKNRPDIPGFNLLFLSPFSHSEQDRRPASGIFVDSTARHLDFRGRGVSAVEDRIRALPIWNGAVSIERLRGGISNESFLVTDASVKHVVRFGKDYPFHHVFREREIMTARAAHAAGFAPEVRYATPGVMVTAFLGAKTYGADDVRENRERIATLIRSFHEEMPRHISGPGFMFWVFHVIRDYARTLDAGGSRMMAELPGYLELAEELERAQTPLPVIFGHNDLLPANFLDDGTRLWLIDFEYAGFNTAMFDLAGAASNAGMSEDESRELLAVYFGREPDTDIHRSHAAMQCASLLREAMWSMVSELHLSAPGVDYVAYTEENLSRLAEALETYRTIYGKAKS
jgi:thiamine kinase-like enzyme